MHDHLEIHTSWLLDSPVHEEGTATRVCDYASHQQLSRMSDSLLCSGRPVGGDVQESAGPTLSSPLGHFRPHINGMPHARRCEDLEREAL